MDVRPLQSTYVHLIVLGWLFVTFTMALTLSSALAGIVLFVGAGLGPVVLWLLLVARRVRARRERAALSVGERDVHATDDGNAERDQ